MKCNEPKPGDTWRTCDKGLSHEGDHRYLNESWPRPVPNEPNPDVTELLDATRPPNTWGLEERSYPVIVVETTVRVLWVDAESEDDAVAYWADDYTDVPLKGADVLDADLEFRRLDDVERHVMNRSNRAESKTGPLIACPDCGREDFRRAWFHDPYRKCHGPIQWRLSPGARRHFRTHDQTPFSGVTA